jgi:nucleoside-diphosphate-sugar epimerase
MADARMVLVAGASGAAATRIAERAAAAPGYEVVGLSRRAPGGTRAWISADLLEAGALAGALSARPDITHVVYASRAPHAEAGAEDVPGNLAMLRNLLDAAEAALPRFAHIHLVQGGK